jgi:asparaginyl-tRNA synthetase
MHMALVKISQILEGNCKDQKVTVRGWVYRKREGKALIFLLIRDSTGVIQSTIKKDSPCWNDAQKLTIESSLILEGTAREDTRAPGGFEIGAETLEIVGLAENFPISKDKSEEFIRDMRHLWLRSRKMNLVMKVRAETLKAAREYFEQQKYTEVSPPNVHLSSSGRRLNTFRPKILRTRPLPDTEQPTLPRNPHVLTRKRLLYCTLFPCRKKPHNTPLNRILAHGRRMALCKHGRPHEIRRRVNVIHLQTVSERCQKEFKELGADIEKLKAVKAPFPRITYKEAIERLKPKNPALDWGSDLGYEDEKVLAEDFGKPFFVYDYPTAIKAFYCKTYRDHPEIAMSVDMMVPRIGEISTGGAKRRQQRPPHPTHERPRPKT